MNSRHFTGKSLVTAIVLFLVITFSLSAPGNTLMVSKDGGRYSYIQKAINAADSGDTIKVKASTYTPLRPLFTKENLKIDKDLTIKGVGQQKVTIKAAKKNRPVILIGSSNINVEISGVKITDAHGEGKPAKVKGISPVGISVMSKASVTIKDSTISGNAADGIRLWGSSHATISNSTVSKNGEDGIDIGYNWAPFQTIPHSSQATIINSTVSSNKKNGILLGGTSRATVKNTTISENGKVGIYLWDSSRIKIQGNLIASNREAGIVLRTSEKIQASHNKLAHNGVAVVGNVSEKLREPLEKPTEEQIVYPNKNYPTLQHAVDALVPGGTILLEGGTYEGGITVSKELNIESLGANQPVIQGEGITTISLIKGADLKLTGIKITGEDNGVFLGSTSQATITDANISGYGDSGIQLSNFTQVTISDAKISENQSGVALSGTSQATIVDSIISDNSSAGICLWDSSQATITETTITNNEGRIWRSSGIELGGSARATVQNNSISKNEVGIRIHEPKKFNGSIEGFCNVVKNNKTDFMGVSESTRNELTECSK